MTRSPMMRRARRTGPALKGDREKAVEALDDE